MEKIKYNQTCLVYLAISNPLFIGSRTLVLFVAFLEFFFGFFIFYLAALCNLIIDCFLLMISLFYLNIGNISKDISLPNFVLRLQDTLGSVPRIVATARLIYVCFLSNSHQIFVNAYIEFHKVIKLIKKNKLYEIFRKV